MSSPTRGLCPLVPRRRAAACVSAARREPAEPIRGTVGLAQSPQPMQATEDIKWGLGPTGPSQSRAEPWPSTKKPGSQLPGFLRQDQSAYGLLGVCGTPAAGTLVSIRKLFTTGVPTPVDRLYDGASSVLTRPL